MKIIIIEDNKTSLVLLKEIIELYFPEKEVAGAFSNAEAALGFLENTKVDLAMTDIKLPDMDGIEFSKICTEKYPEIYNFVGYIDDFYVAELNGSDELSDNIANENFAILSFQNEEPGEKNINVILKGKTKENNFAVITAEYTDAGTLICVKQEQLLSDGAYMIKVPEGNNIQKIFLWDMNNLKPADDYLEYDYIH